MNLGNGNLSGPWFNINLKMSSYQYRKSRYRDKMILQLSYVYNGISYILVRWHLYIESGPWVLGMWVSCEHVLEFGIPMGSFFFFTISVSVWVQIFRLVGTPLPISRGRHPPGEAPPGFVSTAKLKYSFLKIKCYHIVITNSVLCFIGTGNLSAHNSMA